MAIDYDQIMATFVGIAQDYIGSQLSTVGPVGSPEPAVIIARQPNAPQPDYPYCQLDLLSTVQTDGWLLGYGVDEDLNEVFYETPYKLLLSFSIYGGNANKIAHDLEAVFRYQSVIDRIEIETTGTLEETFAVRSIPEKLSSNWLEVAQFQITFNINDQSNNNVNGGDGIFETINIDGEVKRNEVDSDPLLFSVSETSE